MSLITRQWVAYSTLLLGIACFYVIERAGPHPADAFGYFIYALWVLVTGVVFYKMSHGLFRNIFHTYIILNLVSLLLFIIAYLNHYFPASLALRELAPDLLVIYPYIVWLWFIVNLIDLFL